jgi:hypothetical protein
MQTPMVLLKYVAKVLGNAVGGGIVGDLVVEVLPALAQDVWKWWSKDRNAEERRTEIEILVQAGGNEIQKQADELVREVLPHQPPEAQRAVAAYLTQIPASIRRSLRRPSDPTGTTIPANLVPQEADDLLRMLPQKFPRFKPGDHPLVGVDWRLEELLGVGGFGEVWKARNPHLTSAPPVALKFCLDPQAAKVLRNEASVLDRVMRQGKHPGIVQLLRTYLSAETPCLEYEYVEGGDLTGLIHEWHRAEGGLAPHQSVEVMRQLAETVGFEVDPIVQTKNVLSLAIEVDNSALTHHCCCSALPKAFFRPRPPLTRAGGGRGNVPRFFRHQGRCQVHPGSVWIWNLPITFLLHHGLLVRELMEKTSHTNPKRERGRAGSPSLAHTF